MKRTFYAIALLFFAFTANAQDLQTVLARHYTAINAPAFAEMEGLKAYGASNGAQLKLFAQDGLFRLETRDANVLVSYFFDGQTLRSATRSTNAEASGFEMRDVSGEEAFRVWLLSSLHRNALADLEKNAKLKLVGQQDGALAIEAVFRNHPFVPKSRRLTVLLDAETYLVKAFRYELPEGKVMDISSYETFDGAKLPVSAMLNSHELSFHKLVENPAISKGFFARP